MVDNRVNIVFGNRVGKNASHLLCGCTLSIYCDLYTERRPIHFEDSLKSLIDQWSSLEVCNEIRGSLWTALCAEYFGIVFWGLIKLSVANRCWVPLVIWLSSRILVDCSGVYDIWLLMERTQCSGTYCCIWLLNFFIEFIPIAAGFRVETSKCPLNVQRSLGNVASVDIFPVEMNGDVCANF